MAKVEKNSFILYYDYKQHLALLTDEQRGKLLMALFDYGESGTPPELDDMTRMAFSFISSQMDRDARSYQETCEKRSEAGKKGGRPPKSGKGKKAEESKKSNSFSEKQTKAKKADTDTDTDTENDTDTVTDTVTEKDNSLSPLIPQGGKESEGNDPTFDHFWDRYPKQVGKAAAEEEWRKIKKGVTLAEIMIGLEQAKKNPEWFREGGRYIPNPAKWIREQRWNDEPVPTTESAAQVQPPKPGGCCDTMGVLQQIIAEGEHEDQTPF